MRALVTHHLPPSRCLSTPPRRLCTCLSTLNRRDLLLGTSVSLVAAADALADEAGAAPPDAAGSGGGAAGTEAATSTGTAATAAAPRKPIKRRKKAGAKKAVQKAALKPPGRVPRVKLADNLQVSKVGTRGWSPVLLLR